MYVRVWLPEPLEFLNWGWWILHVSAISTFLLIGYLIGRKRRDGEKSLVRGREAYDVVQIPQAYRFLQRGWWVIHLLAITLVFIMGRLLWP